MQDNIAADLITLREWALSKRERWSSRKFWINFSHAIRNLSLKYNGEHSSEIREIFDYIELLAEGDGAIKPVASRTR